MKLKIEGREYPFDCCFEIDTAKKFQDSIYYYDYIFDLLSIFKQFPLADAKVYQTISSCLYLANIFSLVCKKTLIEVSKFVLNIEEAIEQNYIQSFQNQHLPCVKKNQLADLAVLLT